jgi:hypothetical protein
MTHLESLSLSAIRGVVGDGHMVVVYLIVNKSVSIAQIHETDLLTCCTVNGRTVHRRRWW